MELLTLGLLLLVSMCRGGKDTEEDLAHYLVTLPSTLEPPSSLEKKVYKDIEAAIQHWQTKPETEEPSVDSEGSTITPEPRAPRWWNQYLQEKYGDPPQFPDWSNETQIDLYMKTKKRKKWTPSQESEEPMRPNEEPFTWTPFIKDSNAWTQPTWDEAEAKRLGDALVERQSSGGSYGEYQDGPDPSSTNSSESSSEETGPVMAANKSAAAMHRRPGSPVVLQGVGNRLNLQRRGQAGHGPALYNQGRRRIMRGRAMKRKEAQRRDFLKAQLSPEDVETAAEAQNRHLMAIKAYQRKKKNEALKRVWHSAVLKKMRNEVGVHAQGQDARQQEFKARKRRPVAGNLQRVH